VTRCMWAGGKCTKEENHRDECVDAHGFALTDKQGRELPQPIKTLFLGGRQLG